VSKTNDISKSKIEDVEALGGAATSTVRELRNNELEGVSVEEVSGGCCNYTMFLPNGTP